jgi:uncharacterized repeat protein (TIGR03803 family)
MRVKNLLLVAALMAGLSLIPAGRVTAQTFKNLYSFTTAVPNSSYTIYSNSDGAYPLAGLVLSGNTLYGTTSGGGANGSGTVFAVNTDGTGFTNLYSFTALINSTNGDGADPQAGLLLSGDTLLGTTSRGGSGGNGTVFAVNNDGLYFTNLHSFTALSAPFGGTNSDGANPQAGLILARFATVFGTAYNGGPNGNGTVFAVNVDGSDFTNVYNFSAYSHYTNSDGANPQGGLILSGDTVYGTTAGGGAGQNGTVFAVNIDGTGFTNLYSFTALSSVNFANSDGANPFAGLVLSGGTLYGTTHSGGTNDGGTVFSVDTNGTGFAVLHTFTGGSDGDNPYAGLIAAGGTLFGTVGNGGADYGTVIAVTTNGTVCTTLHTFTNSPEDGVSPHASLILSGNTLYGTSGGGTNGSGMVFSLSLPAPLLTVTLSGTNVVLTWPTNALEFTLESATNLVSTDWSIVSPPPVVVNTNNVVTNAISGANLFYRLTL